MWDKEDYYLTDFIKEEIGPVKVVNSSEKPRYSIFFLFWKFV